MPRYILKVFPVVIVVGLSCAAPALAQLAPPSPQPGSAGTNVPLTTQLEQLQQALDALRAELADARQEQELLAAKVADLEQTKVESGSKYHLRLSGLLLVNVVSTRGSVDSLDVPTIAVPRGTTDSDGAFTAGLRQSMIGLELFGPTVRGARTAADIRFDFFAGFPATVDGLSSGLVRMRTATLRADWANTSIAAGQDAVFFSPRSPASLASSAYPALASAGNLWTWTPQVYVEHRTALTPTSKMVIQVGLLDPLSGEPPASEYTRLPTAGERSRLPASAFRVGWQQDTGDRTASVSGGGYYSRQDWGFNRNVHAWAATGDWDIPLGPWFAWSGEIYRGRAISGLGGGAVASVLFDGPPSSADSAALPVDSAGGWSEMKLQTSKRLEFNVAFGLEHSSLPEARTQPLQSGQEPSVSRNASGFVNAIYTLRSNLLFSVEYRRLWTTGFTDSQRTATHLSLSCGVVF